MANLKDILDLSWVNIFLLSLVFCVIGISVVNAIYHYKRSKDVDGKMSTRWNSFLLWFSITSCVLCLVVVVYFVWRVLANVFGKESTIEVFQKILASQRLLPLTKDYRASSPPPVQYPSAVVSEPPRDFSIDALDVSNSYSQSANRKVYSNDNSYSSSPADQRPYWDSDIKKLTALKASLDASLSR